MWAANDPAAGTLFKRRAAAVAVRSLLRSDVQIVKCRVNTRERVINASISPLPVASQWLTKRRARTRHHA
jgi:hypothetical protein